MTKKRKALLEGMVNRFLQAEGVQARFSIEKPAGGYGNNGSFNQGTRLIRVKSTAFAPTLAHEIAHADEFQQTGKTDCKSPSFYKWYEKWERKLKKIGLWTAYSNGCGTY